MLFIDDDDLGVQRFLGFPPPKKIPQAPLMFPIYPSSIGVVLYPLNEKYLHVLNHQGNF